MADQPVQKKSYKDTLNLPKTDFSMKANLVQQEPVTLKRWQQMDLYRAFRQAPHPKGRYVFHDGPPYANGSIHLGHLLNKVLKDFVVRSRTMMGFDVPYTPGWDCHGLPIEHKVMQDLGPAGRELETYKIRRKCQDSADKFLKLQMAQMQRLLTVADYANPYKTMAPGYEGAELDVFAELVAKGLVYRALKPVHWSIENRTALAEAELEYYDREDTSVYVLFEVADSKKLPASLNAPHREKIHLMIWTTTPWTLPANLAAAVHARFDYGLYRFTQQGETRYAILAQPLAAKVLAHAAEGMFAELGLCKGGELTGVTYRHPFIDRIAPVVTAEYVTIEDGTGLVHTAPGHGVEDYQTGKRAGLDIYCPVKEDGAFDATAPEWLRGVNVWKANELVIEKLRAGGNLFHEHKFTHSYPHDWRGKTPTIFRATEQWFIGVDVPVAAGSATLRQRALDAAEKKIAFTPAWGQNRLRGMLESRPDWCISRQRSWGLPIPAFFNQHGEALLTAASVKAVAEIVRTQGSDAWFKLAPTELLAGYDAAQDQNAPAWAKSEIANFKSHLTKGSDIFDVWFDSGCSWNAALKRMQNGDFPADLYLEGADQHRGWFQVSLLTALAATGQAPFRGVLTHGFMVDKDGKKMSKSLGNTLEVETLLKDFGADVCRWWVSSLNYENDIKVDHEFFKLAGEEYRKVRNTIRYLLSNLADFTAPAPAHVWVAADAISLDAWALGELNALIQVARAAYENFDFRRLHEAIFNFCNDTLSAVYLSATKDRLYCDSAAGPRRRRTQTALYEIADALLRLLAPLMPHTADEAWQALHQGRKEPSVHLALFPEPLPVTPDVHWPKIMAWRRDALLQLETTRQNLNVENPLHYQLHIQTSADLLAVFQMFAPELADLCGVSRAEIAALTSAPVPAVEWITAAQPIPDQPRCDRCWKHDGTVRQRSDGGLLCDRCAAAVGI